MPHIAGQFLTMKKAYKWHQIHTRAIFLKNTTKRIHYIVETTLYYARSANPTMIREINAILQVQSRQTWDTEEKSRILLDYAETYPNEVIRYKAINMVLHVD